ncbi:MAG: hypothetical protein KKE61_07970, partial [Proteobacteria bacterium]|nr:hypothetical protein [Pseudomonadota bacterium]
MGRQECVKGPFYEQSNAFLSPQFSSISVDPSTVDADVTTTWTRNFYDARSRVERVQQSGGINTTYAYNNLETTVTDPDGHSKTQVTDSLGRIISVIEHGPTDHITTYSYTAAGDLVKVSRTNPATGNAVENLITYNTL